jgi:hypothetical protein
LYSEHGNLRQLLKLGAPTAINLSFTMKDSLMKITFTASQLPKSGTLVVFATQGGKLTVPAAAVDRASKGQLAQSKWQASKAKKIKSWK